MSLCFEGLREKEKNNSLHVSDDTSSRVLCGAGCDMPFCPCITHDQH